MITINIGDTFTKSIEETHTFDQRDTAQTFLSERVPQLTQPQLNEIFTSPDTQFQINQFRNYPEQGAALQMMVRYEIEVSS